MSVVSRSCSAIWLSFWFVALALLHLLHKLPLLLNEHIAKLLFGQPLVRFIRALPFTATLVMVLFL